MTIDDDSELPKFLQQGPSEITTVRTKLPEAKWRAMAPGEVPLHNLKFDAEPSMDDILKGVETSLDDPLRVVARNLRALTLEQITKMCRDMAKPEMRDTLVLWAAAYLDGGELPLKDERRF